MPRNNTNRMLLPLASGIALLCASALIAGVYFHFRSHAAPQPNRGASMWPESALIANIDWAFPCVDWDYWKSVNPSIAGWVTIPGTSISHPIVAANQNDPDFYLSHDIHNEWNPYGCLYLDASCAPLGLCAQNALIYGHNMDDGSMFAPLAHYANAQWAKDHPHILLQTPEEKIVLRVAFSRVVDAQAESKSCHFANRREFRAWFDEQANNAQVLLEKPITNQVFTFCTCSYSMFPSERTLVFAYRTDHA